MTKNEKETLYLFLLCYWLINSIIYFGFTPFQGIFWFITIPTLILNVLGKYKMVWRHIPAIYFGFILQFAYNPILFFSTLSGWIILIPYCIFAGNYRDCE